MFSRGVPGYAVVTPLPYNGSPYGPVGQCDPGNSAVGYVNIVQRHKNLFSLVYKNEEEWLYLIFEVSERKTFRLSDFHLLFIYSAPYSKEV